MLFTRAPLRLANLCPAPTRQAHTHTVHCRHSPTHPTPPPAGSRLKVCPDLVARVYEDIVMPLTKEVEVIYLLRRLDGGAHGAGNGAGWQGSGSSSSLSSGTAAR